jgi:hypothetical protein
MTNTEKLPDTMFTLSKSTPDSNRFYSILLDTRASAMTENMYDTAEKLLLGEKSNAKSALEHLWALKKNMQNKDELSTIDLLIQYYQTKIDVLRAKEEHIKKISRDSRGLLEDKRKRDAEVATIKQEITDCGNEIQELSAKLKKLKIKEQELTLIESQLKKELVVNENEIVNGLYEIIITSSGGQQPGPDFSERLDEKAPASSADRTETSAEQATPFLDASLAPEAPAKDDPVTAETSAIPASALVNKDEAPPDILDDIDYRPLEKPVKEETEFILYKQDEPEQPPVYPKSVVKTTRGRVVGEYYYDAQAYKNKRAYIFNSKFFLEQLSHSLGALKIAPNDVVYTELLQMIQDAYKRISQNPAMHFEISTNGLLNDKALKELWQNVKAKNYHEAALFCKRLNAKITALGSNYRAILKEQMTRYVA